ncbi:MAG: hypothetical protein ACXW32_14360, partial [Limisphaerales bacterium]
MDEENILTSDVFLDFDEGFPIGKGADGAFAEFNANRFTDRFGERLIGCPGKDFHAITKQKTTKWWSTNEVWTVAAERVGAR